jgi:PAS domain S-box-containing protein
MSVRILHLEDSPVDAELIALELSTQGIDCTIRRVESAEAFKAALEQVDFDLILSDFAIPGFDGRAALSLGRERCPDVPFLFVTGTIGEEAAVELFQGGATDYVLKDRLARLPNAVRRALAEAAERRARRDAEQQLVEQAALLDKARDAIVAAGLDNAIHFWNKSAERIYGYTAQEALWKNAEELLRTEAPKLADAKKAVLERGEWIGELPRVRKDGRKILVESRWSLVHGRDGRPQAILSIDTDVTEQRRTEAQFLRAQRLESIGTLAGGIAHDLNNVLAPILMAADVLRRKVSDDRGRRMVMAIDSSARRCAELVKQILTFARGIEGERVVLQPRHVVGEIEKIARETFPKTIQLRFERAGDLWNVSGDATQLHQVLLNLCVNARDAMPHGGILTVQAENVSLDEHYAAMQPEAAPGPYVLLSVTDTGTGIAAGVLDRIFEPFFTTKEPGKGTGLGLSTSLAIVKNHRGFMAVYSEPGKGTTFKVYLPALTSPTSAAKAPRAAPQAIGGGQTILVVDDEASIRELTKETLESHGFRVLTASDGAEAVAAFAGAVGSIKAVVTDMTMPLMDGAATIRALRKMDPGVKIIATSGLAANDRDQDAADAFLQKPYTADELLSAIQDVLRR